MTKYVSLALLIAVAFLACKNEKPASGEPSPETKTTEIPYTLVCKDLTQAEDKIPHHDVYAIINGDSLLVGTIEDCKRILPENYADYEIPENAYDAVGGTNAENRTYAVYIGKSPEGKITARIGHNYPGKPSGSFDYRSMVVIEEKIDINPGSDINPGALVGSYVHNGPKTSQVLYLGLNNRTLMGQIFTLDGPLPEQEDSLLLRIAQTAPEVLSNIQVNFSDLSFSSMKGPGSFTRNGNRIESITFSKWKDGSALTLEKKAIGKEKNY